MNYLAHVLLARPTPAARLGALMGDFARGLDVEALPGELREGLLEHRAVDAFVDAHPLVVARRRTFPAPLRRFAGVLLDVFHDHFLVRQWDRLAEEPLEEVTASLYGAFESHARLLPPRLARVAGPMARDDWLSGYGSEEHVARALEGMARRLRRPTPLAQGIEVLRERREELEQEFLVLFPEVRDFVGRRRRALDAGTMAPRSTP